MATFSSSSFFATLVVALLSVAIATAASLPGDAGLEDECPKDSVRDTGGACVCDAAFCHKPQCTVGAQQQKVANGTGEPGQCCDIYDCVLSAASPGTGVGTGLLAPPENCTSVTCPPLEPCPADSYRLPSRGGPDTCCPQTLGCQCAPCPEPSCDAALRPRVVTPGSGQPGTCCPTFQCADGEAEKRLTVKHHDTRPADGPHGLHGCMRNNTLYGVGETWQEDNGCMTCTCKPGGKTKCQAYMCQVTCDNPRHVPGECCPTCEGTSEVTETDSCPSVGNCSLRCVHGFVQDSAGCTLCQCQQEACTVECPDGYAQDALGNTVCACARKCPPFDCAKQCPHGYRTGAGGCKVCKCLLLGPHQGQHCRDTPPCNKQCPHGRASDNRGCPTCRCLPADSSRSLSSSFAGKEVSHFNCSDGVERDDGEAWSDGCSQCYCAGGRVMCELLSCPVLVCDSPVYAESECCPRCPAEELSFSRGSKAAAPVSKDVVASVCQSVGATLRPEGAAMLWTAAAAGGCARCRCSAGQILCEEARCPPAPCQDPRPASPGSCCPECPPITGSSEGADCGHGRPHGSIWRDGPCSSCQCVDGRDRCFATRCPSLHCKLQVRVRGLCCPVCLDEPVLGSSASLPPPVPLPRWCHWGNQSHSPGTEWSPVSSGSPGFPAFPDLCTRCYCDPAGSGTTTCTRVVCSDSSCGRCAEDSPEKLSPVSTDSLGGSLGVLAGCIVVIAILCALVLVLTFLCLRRSRSHTLNIDHAEIKSASNPAYSSPSKYSYNMIPTSPPEKTAPL